VRALVVSQWWQYGFSHHTFAFLCARRKVFDFLKAKLVFPFAVLGALRFLVWRENQL
jgi:hypothetical protein